MTQPTKWSAPLGNGADVQELPDDDLRYASFSKIFPQITQVPLSAGGVAPRRIDFNSLFKLLADNIYYYQNGGVFEYSDTADYEKGAIVRYNDKIYLCIQDNSALNTHNPEDMNYWLRVALNNELADYLPLAGGNVTGNLSVQNKNVVRSVNGVDANEIGNIQLDGLVRSVNGVNADASGNVNITVGEIDSFSYGIVGYIRYKNGLQLCWGSAIDYRTNYTANTTITFLKPFYDTNYAIIGTGFWSKSHAEQTIQNVTTTGFETEYHVSQCGTGGFLAIGRWK